MYLCLLLLTYFLFPNFTPFLTSSDYSLLLTHLPFLECIHPHFSHFGFLLQFYSYSLPNTVGKLSSSLYPLSTQHKSHIHPLPSSLRLLLLSFPVLLCFKILLKSTVIIIFNLNVYLDLSTTY